MPYIVATVLFLFLLFLIISLAKLTVKTTVVIIIAFFLTLSLFSYALQPKNRKPFNLNVIEKVLKINPDGSTTIIETTTTTELKQKWKK